MALRERFYSLDAIRGIAALLVVLRHAPDFFGRRLYFQESYLAVDLFFLLSGFVLGEVYDDRLRSSMSGVRFVAVRVVRLYPVYLVGALIGVGAECIALRYGIHSYVPPHLFVHVLLDAALMFPLFSGPLIELYPLNAPSWSLLFEIVANCAYGFGARLINIRRLLFVMTVSAIGLAVSAAPGGRHFRSGSLDGGNVPASFTIGLFRLIYSFAAGLLIFHVRRRIGQGRFSVPRFAAKWFLLCGLVGVTTILLLATPRPSLNLLFDVFTVTCLFPLLVVCSILGEPAAGRLHPLIFLGLISYPLYMIHAPTAFGIEALLRGRYGIDVGHYAPWAGLLLFALLLPLSLFVETKIDSPLRTWFGQRLKKTNGRSKQKTVPLER